jgi:hypothetical protein
MSLPGCDMRKVGWKISWYMIHLADWFRCCTVADVMMDTFGRRPSPRFDKTTNDGKDYSVSWLTKIPLAARRIRAQLRHTTLLISSARLDNTNGCCCACC